VEINEEYERCKFFLFHRHEVVGGVSQLNGGGCSFRSGRKRHIHSSESAYLINQKLKKKMHSMLNSVVLVKPYKLGFFVLGFGNLQFDLYSSNFV
jgi:hypothetical protein